MPKPIFFLTVSIGLSVWIVILMIPWLWVGPWRLAKRCAAHQYE
jgi:CRISPR/Cas system CMR subunit Cmr6 (Cas7 group RAMP superfamily)